MAHRRDHLGDGGMPALKQGERLGVVRRGESFFRMRPVTRAFDHRKEIDVAAVSSDRIVEEMRRGTHPELSRLRVRKRRKLPDGDDASKAARSGIEEPVVASYKASHDRTHAISRNYRVGFDDSAVREAQCDPAATLGKVHEAPAEVEASAVDARAERLLKFGPMNAAIGRAETLPIGAADADGMGCDPFAGPAIAIDKLGRLRRRGDDWIENPEAAEFAGRVGRQRDRCADFREFTRLLVEVSEEAALPERQPKR